MRGGPRWSPIAILLSMFAGFVTFVYYCLQSFYGVFVFGYIFSTAIIFLWIFALVFLYPQMETNTSNGIGARLGRVFATTLNSLLCHKLFPDKCFSLSPAHRQRQRRAVSQAKTCLKCVVIGFGAIGFSSWLIDMHLCQGLLPFYNLTWGFTLHVVWHVGAAYGGYLHIQTLILLRAGALGLDLHLQWPRGYLSQSDWGEALLCCFYLPVIREQKTLQKCNSASSTLADIATPSTPECDEGI